MKIVLVALNATYGHTNLAIRYLKNVLSSEKFNESDIETVCMEFTINDDTDKVIEELYLEEGDIYAFSCYIWNIVNVSEIACVLKKLLKKSLIVMGGPQVSYETDKLCKQMPYVDYIVRGQGEKAFCDIVESIISGNPLIGNFIEKETTKIISSASYEFENIGFPYKNEYSYIREKQVYYESSRGCPYSCTYCISSLEKGVKFLGTARVKKELKFFIDNKINQVKLVDRTFNFNDSRAIEIWEYLSKLYRIKPYNTNFHFEICGDILSEKSLEVLGRAPSGIFRFEIGVQSTDSNVLRNINRKSDIPVLFENIRRLIQRKNIVIHLDLIAGLPDETEKVFKKSFNETFLLYPDMLQLGFLKILPGSIMKSYADRNKIIYSNVPPYEIIDSPYLPYTVIRKIKKIQILLDRYYNSGHFKYSLKFILGLFGDDIYDFFSVFAAELRKNGKFSRKLSRKEVIDDLYNFAIRVIDKSNAPDLNKDTYRKLFSDLMKYDYYRFDKKGNIKNIEFNNSSGTKMLPDKYINSELLDKDRRWKLKKARTEKYSFDAAILIREERPVMRESIVIYDISADKPIIKDIIYTDDYINL